MPLVVGCLALIFPRLALFMVWLFGGGYLGRAIESGFWLLLGFFFMPLTTLTFAFAFNSLGPPGQVPPFGWVLVIIAVLADFGLIGNGQHRARKHYGKRRRD